MFCCGFIPTRVLNVVQKSGGREREKKRERESERKRERKKERESKREIIKVVPLDE